MDGVARKEPPAGAPPRYPSSVAKSSTRFRLSRVSCFTGRPIGSSAETAKESGSANIRFTSASAGATNVVSVPPSPSLRAARRMFQTNG